jgi:methionyl-tRNA synthetase
LLFVLHRGTMPQTLIFAGQKKKTVKFKRHTVTAALPYANGPKHIGHLAGAYLPADVYVRYLRSKKEDVIYVCGSDEHGTAIANQALKENTTPRAIIDKYHVLMKDSFEQLGISFDIYHRTSEPLHHETAQEFFTTLFNNGTLIEETTEQYFDEKAGQFLADRYIIGTCPNCGYESAYGDQCEKCGKSLNPTDLIHPRSTLSGEKPVLKKTKNWFLPMDKLQPKIEAYIESHKDWKVNVYGQCKSWLNQGLQPRAMTRDLNWGVKVPLPDAEGKVLYVWFDAPIGYISATKQWGINNNKDWEPYWKSKDTRLIHFLAKDNIVFHCITFPLMLMQHGEYILPDNVPGNEFMNLEGDKMSTSRKWSIEMHDYIHDFPDKPDPLRYCLTSILPETKDSEFTWKDFQARNNNELVAILGNFVNRTLVLTHNYYKGLVPAADTYTKEDLLLLGEMSRFPDKIGASLEQFRFREAQAEMMNLARMGNKYLADNEPWKLIKTDENRVRTILNISLQIAANLTIVMEPFLPFTAKKLSGILNLSGKIWDDAKRTDLLMAGQKINEAVLLFEKIEDAVIDAQLAKLAEAKKLNEANAPANTIEVAKPDISFDDFAKMDIRTGTILEAERVPKTDKLLKLKIDTGIDQRTVVSGIAAFYKPEDIIGQQVSILVNLAPRKIKGIESQGMILMAENNKGELSFVAPTKGNMNNGSGVK